MSRPDSAQRRTVALLACAQALFQTATIMLVVLSAIIGLALAPRASLATLPTALYTVAAAAMMIPASLLMQRVGRRAGFMLGTLFGCVAGLLAAWSIHVQAFWLFVFANMLMGCYQGFAQYYRFAAADAASDAFRSRAISWVIAAGVVAAIAGPNLVRFTQDLGPQRFVAPFLVIFALSFAALLVVTRLDRGIAASPDARTGEARPLRSILRQGVFLTALTGSTVGFAAMVMVMTATPLAMQMGGHSLGASATVIQWHVLGMFVPSFFTGELIRRFGVLTVMAAGVLILATHVAIALSGAHFGHFVAGLILLGVGWNFLFIGGTTLLTEAYRPAERAKTQAAHDFLMFAVASIASFSAGALLDAWGWRSVNWTVLPFLVLALVAIAGLGISRYKARGQRSKSSFVR